jgi:tetratricopeptide (TPR) repeat protein
MDVPLQQPKPTLDGPPSAAELARAAERSMAAGRRDETIRLLTQLVRRYPKSSPARAALFDLGRLLRASGRNDEARCAYHLLRQRWPSDAMRGEIDRVLKSLGDGPECRGLQPLP